MLKYTKKIEKAVICHYPNRQRNTNRCRADIGLRPFWYDMYYMQLGFIRYITKTKKFNLIAEDIDIEISGATDNKPGPLP